MPFKIIARDPKSGARLGAFSTPHGEVQTPMFMPVATKGSVKTISPDELHDIGTQAIIANALHLHVRPGEDRLAEAGGLHKFMRWDNPIFTDSGGFQVIRKAFGISITEEGLHFRDFFSGAPLLYTPELCMEVQKKIGSDVAMLLDDCPFHDATPEKVKDVVERTVRWAKRGMARGRELGIPHLFPVAQGGRNYDLRKWCIEELNKLNPDGFGIGGLSIGEPKPEMMRILSETTHMLPDEKPRYLMGVGSVNEMLESISLGVDVFDSVFPTQCARHGTIFTKQGRYNMKGAKLEGDFRPLDEDCQCPTCRQFTRSYVNHLLREGEMLGMRLASIHNVYFLLDLVRGAREAIQKGTFGDFKRERMLKEEESDERSLAESK
jgi:queuine tRNA-ribosyltransferase